MLAAFQIWHRFGAEVMVVWFRACILALKEIKIYPGKCRKWESVEFLHRYYLPI